MSSRFRQVLVVGLSLLGGSTLGVGCNQLSSQRTTGPSATAAPEKAGTPASNPKLVAKYRSLAAEILDTRNREVELVRSILEQTYREAEAALAQAREALRSSNASAARPAVENLAILVSYLATEGDASVAGVRKQLIEGGHHFNPLAPPGSVSGAPHHAGNAQPPGHHAPGQGQAGQGAPPQPGQGQAQPAGQVPGAAAPGQPPPGAQAPGGQPPGGHHAGGDKPAGAPGQADGAHHHAGPEGHHRSEAGHHEGNASLMGYDPGYVVVPRAAKKTLLDASRALARMEGAPNPAALEAEWSKVVATCSSLGIAKK